MDNIEEKLTQKYGPLAGWQWGLLAAGGVFLYSRIKGGGSGNGTTTVQLTPNGPTGIASPQTSTGSIGSLLTQLGAEYPMLSFTLPDGTSFQGENGLFTTPTPPSTGGTGSGGGATNPPPVQSPPSNQNPSVLSPAPTPSILPMPIARILPNMRANAPGVVVNPFPGSRSTVNPTPQTVHLPIPISTGRGIPPSTGSGGNVTAPLPGSR